METKDLQREISDAERLAERGKIILQQHSQLQALQGKLATTEQQLAETQAELDGLKKAMSEISEKEPKHDD